VFSAIQSKKKFEALSLSEVCRNEGDTIFNDPNSKSRMFIIEIVDKRENNVTEGPEYGFFRYFTIFVVMEFKFWLYVIIGVIYLLNRVLKKKAPEAPKNTEQPRPQSYKEPRGPQTQSPRQLTFEELLKEITEAKQHPKPVSQPVSGGKVIDYDEEIGEEEQDLETIEPDYSRRKGGTYKVYEDAKRDAFSRPSLEETMKVSDTKVQFEKFKAFEQNRPNSLLTEYVKQFQDPEGLKKAVVMAEILNRKF
jgi:hypothetical protein